MKKLIGEKEKIARFGHNNASIKNHYALLVDVEAIGINNPFVYDIGIIIMQRNNEGYYSQVGKASYVVKQVYDNKPLFETAYFKEKRPRYVSALRGHHSKRKYLGHLMQDIKRWIKAYDIKKVYAYNADYDKKAIQYTTDFFKVKNPFSNIKWIDIYAITTRFVHDTVGYREFCKKHGYITRKGNVRGTAEHTIRYLLNDIEFTEEHTGLQDCHIERRILNYCIRRGYDYKHYTKKFIPIYPRKKLKKRGKHDEN